VGEGWGGAICIADICIEASTSLFLAIVLDPSSTAWTSRPPFPVLEHPLTSTTGMPTPTSSRFPLPLQFYYVQIISVYLFFVIEIYLFDNNNKMRVYLTVVWPQKRASGLSITARPGGREPQTNIKAG